VDGFDFPNKPKEQAQQPKTRVTEDPFAGKGQIDISDDEMDGLPF
jgi:hypothetical protein